MKHKYFAILFLLMISVLTACSGGSESTKTSSQDSVTVKHDLGETKVKNNPKKVVVLELGFIDALLDAGIKPVGIADDGKPKFINENVREKSKGILQSVRAPSQVLKNCFFKARFNNCRFEQAQRCL